MTTVTEYRYTADQVAQTAEIAGTTLRLWYARGVLSGQTDTTKVVRTTYSILDIAQLVAVNTLSEHIGLGDSIKVMKDVVKRFKSWPVAVEIATREVKSMYIFVRKYPDGIPDQYFFYGGSNFDEVHKLLDQETTSMAMYQIGKPISAILQRLPGS